MAMLPTCMQSTVTAAAELVVQPEENHGAQGWQAVDHTQAPRKGSLNILGCATDDAWHGGVHSTQDSGMRMT